MTQDDLVRAAMSGRSVAGRVNAAAPMEVESAEIAADVAARTGVVPAVKQKPRGAWDVFREASIGERLPFVGTAMEFDSLAEIVSTARRVQAGNGSAKDEAMLDAWMQEQSRETTWGGKVADIVLEIPKFAGEFIASGSAVTGGKVAASKGAKVLASKALREKVGKMAARATANRVGKVLTGKAAKQIANAGARVVAMDAIGSMTGGLLGMEHRGGIVHQSAARLAMKEARWNQDEFGHFQLSMDEMVPTTMEMMPEGFIDSMIEVYTEMVGGELVGLAGSKVAAAGKKLGLPVVPVSSQVKALQLKIVDDWLKISPAGKRTVQDFLRLAKKGGYNGVIGEVLEERLGGALRIGAELLPGVNANLDGLEQLFPGFSDLSAEIAAFSVLPAGFTAGIAAKEAAVRRHYGTDVGSIRLNKEMQFMARAADFSKLQTPEPDFSNEENPEVARQVWLDKQALLRFDRSGTGQAPLNIDDIRIYGVGELTPEIETRMQAALGGNAAADQTDTGNNIFGNVSDVRSEEEKGQTVTADDLMVAGSELANTDLKEDRPSAYLKTTIGKRRAKNIGEEKPSPDNYSAGIDLKTLHARVGRVGDIGELTVRAMHQLFLRRFGQKAGAIVDRVLESQADQLDEGAAPDESNPAFRANPNAYIFPAEVFEPGGELRLSDGALIELTALGSFQSPVWDGASGQRQLELGLLEFFRMVATADGAVENMMPEVTAWFRDVFSVNEPQMAAAIEKYAQKVGLFRRQGAFLRASSQHLDTGSIRYKADQIKKRWLGPDGKAVRRTRFSGLFLSKAFYLRRLSDAIMRHLARTGSSLDGLNEKRPDEIFEALAKEPQAVAEQFTLRYPIDWNGKRVADTKSIVEIGESIADSKYNWMLPNVILFQRARAAWEDRPAVYEYDAQGNKVLKQYGGEGTSRKTKTVSEPRAAGVGYEDAVAILARMEEIAPEITRAATEIYKWWDAVLDRVAAASPAMRGFVERMRDRDPGNYAPLMRVIGDLWTKQAGSGDMSANGLMAKLAQPFEGSMEPVNDVFRELQKRAEDYFALANASRVAWSFTQFANEPFAQDYFRILRPDQVVVADQSMAELMSILDEAGKAYIKSITPGKGGRRGPGSGNRWSSIENFVLQQAKEEMEGFEKLRRVIMEPLPVPTDMAQTLFPDIDSEGNPRYIDVVDPGLMWFLDEDKKNGLGGIWDFAFKLLSTHKKLYTATTTSLRIAFVTKNLVRDLLTSLINTQSAAPVWDFRDFLNAIKMSGIPARSFFFTWMQQLTQEFKYSTVVPWLKSAAKREAATKPTQDLSRRLGLMAGSIKNESFTNRETTRTIRGMAPTWRGKVIGMYEYLTGMMNSGESVSRVTELDLLVREMGGYENFESMSFETRVKLLLAMKRVSTNFTVGGTTAMQFNQIIPFFNAAIQGPRDTLRAVFGHGEEVARKKISRAIKLYTLPTIALWLMYKDDDWWNNMPAEDKARNWYIPLADSTIVLQIPMPFEIGTFFAGAPLAMLDAWNQESPNEVNRFFHANAEGLSGILAQMQSMVPSFFPPALRLPFDMASNKKAYWGTPIVSKTLENLAPEAQFDEYTTGVAKWLGKLPLSFGAQEGWSPKKIDYLIGALGGRLSSDAAKTFTGQESMELGGTFSVPVFSSWFREPLAHPMRVNDLFAAYKQRQRTFDTKVTDEDEREQSIRNALRDAMRAVTAIGIVMRDVKDRDQRGELQKERLRIAEHALKMHETGVYDPDMRDLFKAARDKYEPDKEAIKDREKQARRESLGE